MKACGSIRPPEGNYDFVYSGDDRGSRWAAARMMSEPPIRMTLNKVAELVEIFGPILVRQKPHPPGQSPAAGTDPPDRDP